MNTQVAAKANLTFKKEKKQSFFQQVKRSLAERVSGLKSTYSVRRIKAEDNWAARDLIQKALLQRGGIGLDLFYYDKELSDLYHNYNWSDAFFGVLTLKKAIIGTVGIHPVIDAQNVHSANVCELKKLHVAALYQDLNLKEMLLMYALKRAAALGYTEFRMLLDEREQELDRLLTRHGFECRRDSVTGMKVMVLASSPSVLSKAS